MADMYVEKMARLLTEYSTGIKDGDIVMISGDTRAKDMMLSVYREVIRLGGHPFMRPSFSESEFIFFNNASEKQLDFLMPFMEDIMNTIDVSIAIDTDTNVKQLTSIDPERISRKSRAQSPLMEIFMKRQATGDLRWVVGPCPSEALAQEASMSLEEYESFVYSACLLDRQDPIEEWKSISKMQQKACDYLSKKHSLRIVGEDTDITLDIGGRKWINCDGDNNMPDGEVFTGPVEDSAEGTIRFTYPGIYMGREVEDIRLRFKEGKVVEAHASRGEDLLEKMIHTDSGASYIGEAAIGTNYGIKKFTKNMLFDEKIGGTIHMALGAGYPDSGSSNTSSIHWDILKDMRDGGKIYADGELFYENGAFSIDL